MEKELSTPPPFDLESENKKIWNQLSTAEQSICITYKNHLIRNKPPLSIRMMIDAVNKIHSKYDGFGMDCVP